jgi:hypothetical protein
VKCRGLVEVEKYRKELEGTPEAFRPGEDLEQHRKRLGY